ASLVRKVLEELGRAAGEEATPECVRSRYRPLLMVATLGLYLALFQQCASREAALKARAVLEKPTVDLGSQGYEG
ncbi:MAG: hypothetical protein LRS43_00440, partial [Desulfurococcales archaeon]|nr:hypothetical protein [Desulfurococcales archaeon]